MKRNYYDIIATKAYKAHLKAEALHYLFSSFHDTGSSQRDEDAIAGISYILEDISNDVRQVHNMLDDVSRPPLNTEVEDVDNYLDGYPKNNYEKLLPSKSPKERSE